MNKRCTGKPGEIREHLSDEAILSQARWETSGKVQRLEDEAKGSSYAGNSSTSAGYGDAHRNDIVRAA